VEQGTVALPHLERTDVPSCAEEDTGPPPRGEWGVPLKQASVLQPCLARLQKHTGSNSKASCYKFTSTPQVLVGGEEGKDQDSVKIENALKILCLGWGRGMLCVCLRFLKAFYIS
jgi:hypothetical protein